MTQLPCRSADGELIISISILKVLKPIQSGLLYGDWDCALWLGGSVCECVCVWCGVVVCVCVCVCVCRVCLFCFCLTTSQITSYVNHIPQNIA